MKHNIYKFILIFASLTLLFGCHDKDQYPDITPINMSLDLNYYSDFYDLTIPNGLAWEITSCPEWISPEQMFGESGTDISIYVCSNIDDISRTGELEISCSDKTTIIYSLTQKSKTEHDENSIIFSEKKLQRTYGVGFGVNVFLDGKQSKYHLCSGVVDPTKLIKALGDIDINESDAFYHENQYYSRTESHIGNSISDISTSLSVGAGIDLDISGFKASVEGKFTQNESTHEEYAYALRQIQHIVGSRYLRAGMLRTFAREGVDVFEYDMTRLMNRIKDNPGDKSNIKLLIDTYGTHVIVHGLLGGELELALEMRSSEKISETDIHAALNLSAEVINASGSVDMDEKETEISQNTKISFRSYGGTNIFTFAPGSSFEQVLAQTMKAELLNGWVAKIKEGSSLALVDINTCPIYDLMPTDEARNAVREYIVNDYQKQVNGHGPMMYSVTGFSDPNTLFGTVEIEDINVRMEYYQETVPEITSNGLCTIVYSGTLDKMNYDCGFFIGDNSRKPGKLRKNRDGSFTYEPFEGLSAQAISELYVDPTGSVTIAPKVTDNYSNLMFNSVESFDISTLWNNNVKIDSNNCLTIFTKYLGDMGEYPNTIVMDFPGYNTEWICTHKGRDIAVNKFEVCFLSENNIDSVLDKLTFDNYKFNQIKFNLPRGTNYIVVKMLFDKDATGDYFTQFMLNLFEFGDEIIRISYLTPRWG